MRQIFKNGHVRCCSIQCQFFMDLPRSRDVRIACWTLQNMAKNSGEFIGSACLLFCLVACLLARWLGGWMVGDSSCPRTSKQICKTQKTNGVSCAVVTLRKPPWNFAIFSYNFLRRHNAWFGHGQDFLTSEFGRPAAKLFETQRGHLRFWGFVTGNAQGFNENRFEHHERVCGAQGLTVMTLEKNCRGWMKMNVGLG